MPRAAARRAAERISAVRVAPRPATTLPPAVRNAQAAREPYHPRRTSAAGWPSCAGSRAAGRAGEIVGVQLEQILAEVDAPLAGALHHVVGRRVPEPLAVRITSGPIAWSDEHLRQTPASARRRLAIGVDGAGSARAPSQSRDMHVGPARTPRHCNASAPAAVASKTIPTQSTAVNACSRPTQSVSPAEKRVRAPSGRIGDAHWRASAATQPLHPMFGCAAGTLIPSIPGCRRRGAWCRGVFVVNFGGTPTGDR
jgi:hypothetical protein